MVVDERHAKVLMLVYDVPNPGGYTPGAEAADGRRVDEIEADDAPAVGRRECVDMKHVQEVEVLESAAKYLAMIRNQSLDASGPAVPYPSSPKSLCLKWPQQWPWKAVERGGFLQAHKNTEMMEHRWKIICAGL